MNGKEHSMNYLGIEYSVRNMPALDPGFIPFGIWAKAYLQDVYKRQEWSREPRA